MQETRAKPLGREDSLEKEIATHSNIFAWRTPRTEELGGYNTGGRKESDMTQRLNTNAGYILLLSSLMINIGPRDIKPNCPNLHKL